MMHLQFKFKSLLIVAFIFQNTLFAGGLSIFRGDTYTLDRFVKETTSSVVQTFKSVTHSVAEADPLLDFLLGEKATEKTKAKELERLEAKIENAERLSGKEEASLELLTNGPGRHGEEPRAGGAVATWPSMDCFSVKALRNDEIGIIVLAPGQELLQYLHTAIAQMADNNRPVSAIEAELNQIWNHTNYKNSTRVTELKKLVTELMGRVIDLRNIEVKYDGDLKTFGERATSQLNRQEFDFVPTTLVLGIVIFDSVLANLNDIDLNVDVIQGLLGASMYVAQSVMHRSENINSLFGKQASYWSYQISIIAEVLFRPQLLFNTVTRVQGIWNDRVRGVDVCSPISTQGYPKQALAVDGFTEIARGTYGTVLLTPCNRWAVKILEWADREGAISGDSFREPLRPESEWILRIASIQLGWSGVNLISPYCAGGTLRDAIKEKRTRNPEVARQSIFQILQALTVLGRRGITQADVKPKNILLQAKGKLVLCDFGLACPNIAGFRGNLVIATAGYRAPEVLFGIGPITPAVDVFAAGAVFWEMLTGAPFLTPMSGEKPTEYDWVMNQLAAMNVITGIPDENGWPELYQKYSKQIIEEWRKGMTNLNRDNLVEVHREFIEPLPRDALNLFTQMTIWNPQKRIKASEALKHPYFRDLNPSQQDDD